MSDISAGTKPKKDSTDLLLWLGGLVIAGVGASWLVVTQPWSSGPASVTTVSRVPQRTSTSSQPAVEQVSEPESVLEDSIRVARLAFEAGMLLEPEEYSAWSLYGQVLEDEPGHAAARQGLGSVADVLVERGASALEQGRLEDVRSVVDRILGTLPEHGDAQRLATDLDAALSIAAEAEAAAVAEAAAAAEAVAAEDAMDRLLDLRASFETAIADNHLLTPAQESAKHYVELMTTMNPDDESTLEARQLLFDSLVERATVAIGSQDVQAAQIWIEEADTLDVDAARVSAVNAALTAHLIEMESLKRMPASSLETIELVAAEYPMRAATRGIEGWVDIEFVVTLDGATRDVIVTEASHDSYFQREAVDAVEAWRFEPRVFMGQSIEQHAYTRVRFALQ